MRNYKVLAIAEAANPEWTSVPLVGWSLSQSLSEIFETHIVTQIRNRDAFVRAGLVEGTHFTAIDSEAVAAKLYSVGQLLRGGSGKGWTTYAAFSALSYYYFEHLLWKEFGGRVADGEFDIVHRITPLSPTVPSLIAAKCKRANVPFVWGPLNGGIPWPKGFGRARRREREWLSYIRGAYKLLPGYVKTRKSASATILASIYTLEQMPSNGAERYVYIPENGIDPDTFGDRVEREVELPIRAAFVGRLIPYKGADMVIEAAASLIRDGKIVLDIIGDGPERETVEKAVRAEGLTDGVRIDGWVEHSALQKRVVQSDILAFPSIREFGGGVVLEAMALGLVPIVMDYGGPGELVTDLTGFKIPMASRGEIVNSLRMILEDLVSCPEKIRAKGARARKRVHSQFTWSAKAQQIGEVYDWVLGHSVVRPDFGRPFPD